MAENASDQLLAPVAEVDGFRLACLIDASTGMVLASAPDTEGLSVPAAAASAADIANVLSLLSGYLAMNDVLEDVMVTFGNHFHVIRPVRPDSGEQILLLVVLDRSRANLALARHEIRQYCEGLSV